MIDLRTLSRRGFLNMGALGAASMMLPAGVTRPALAAAPLAPVKEEEAVVAFSHVGPISDEGWTWAHHQGVLAVQEAYPKLKKVLEVENVPYSADATRTFRQFVSEGASVVFDTSSKGDFLYEVVKRSPEVAFLECDGHTVEGNLGWYYIAHWYPTYVLGVAAGHLSKSGRLGYVASFPVPSVFCSTNAFLMGARSVNPKATLQTIVINSWFDPQAAAQAGTALIDNGCDFLFGIMDEAAYLQVAEKRGVWAAMWNTDIRRYGPSAYVSSIIIDFRKFYVDQVGKRLAGTWAPGEFILPLGGGVDRDAWGEKVPKEVAAAADAVRDKILGGWSPFAGEIKDASGAVRLAAGQTMSEKDLYDWDWSIEGISGLNA
ncbi:BMP family ABC transporter substrate-binding protein [Xaviernesmea oryzae]|uniref:BMP family ABC transporter substrate-binding protein n=1 Tax=Xaviernesmea oryzae TaxID=464029 RepID=A0A1Q9AXT9_9HYPH|nr:BMP family ABC transporter substrate-binding protein [Xaviernesmea oryzae]OLP60257.1 BMP family ABC transporter substrate-binding protein [Xaviernesmea oryzae]SEK26068.1 Basic membrane lipoprotein Med, substrate-binding protein (PBP1-ABC) superfamily [Xaviernesmea oryzae]